MNIVLVVKVLDAPGIPVPIHRADAQLTHRCLGVKQPKILHSGSRDVCLGKAELCEKQKQKQKQNLIKGKVDLEPSFGERGRKWSGGQG